MSVTLLYVLLVLLPNLSTTSEVVFTLLAVACLIYPFIAIAVNEKMISKKSAVKTIKIHVVLFLVSGAAYIITPSENQIYMITGGYIATNIEGIDELPANLVGAANSFLENYTKEVEEND